MAAKHHTATYEPLAEVATEQPTLIEGLPGHGLVASIAVDLIRSQLELTHCANITSEAFPPVVTFEDGIVQDLVRVYGCTNPSVMTLESDMALPEQAYRPLSECLNRKLGEKIGQGVFLAGAPAENEAELGEVHGVATSEDLRERLVDAGVPVAEDLGLVGGITGALVRECYHADVPATLLVVKSHPFLPDPVAAKAVIETALEPLVDFDVDTTPLDEKADEIQTRMKQIASQYEQMHSAGENEEIRTKASGMYQ